ncbi:MAG: hypothetical protein AVDCRST_MAG28-1793, partial [uncultured Rubrobacteraceae bacterium]
GRAAAEAAVPDRPADNSTAGGYTGRDSGAGAEEGVAEWGAAWADILGAGVGACVVDAGERLSTYGSDGIREGGRSAGGGEEPGRGRGGEVRGKAHGAFGTGEDPGSSERWYWDAGPNRGRPRNIGWKIRGGHSRWRGRAGRRDGQM